MGGSVARLCVSLLILSGFAGADTINFDEFPATNNNVPLTVLYAGMGVTFGTDNSGTWGGNSNGDPGNWDLEGTNGPQFLGNNGLNNGSTYVTSIFFATSVANVSVDVSRSNGSSPGQTLTASAFDGATLLGSTTVTLGPINTWTTISLMFEGIDSVILDGSQTGFSPYGVDDLNFNVSAAVPEPASLTLLLVGTLFFGWRRFRLNS